MLSGIEFWRWQRAEKARHQRIAETLPTDRDTLLNQLRQAVTEAERVAETDDAAAWDTCVDRIEAIQLRLDEIGGV